MFIILMFESISIKSDIRTLKKVTASLNSNQYCQHAFLRLSATPCCSCISSRNPSLIPFESTQMKIKINIKYLPLKALKVYNVHIHIRR